MVWGADSWQEAAVQHRSSVLSDNPEGKDAGGTGGNFQREGTHGYLWLIDVGQQKQTRCKAIILQ